MEAKFVVRHPVTLELYKEWAKNPIASGAIEKRKKSIRIRIVGCALSALLIGLGALSGELYIAVIGAAFLVLYLLRLFYIPNRTISKSYESALKVMGGQWMRTVTFSDKVVVEDGRNQTRFEYYELSKVTEDDNNIYLFFTADMVLRLPKDIFTTGSPDGFREFINNAITVKAAADKAEETETAEEDLGL